MKTGILGQFIGVAATAVIVGGAPSQPASHRGKGQSSHMAIDESRQARNAKVAALIEEGSRLYHSSIETGEIGGAIDAFRKAAALCPEKPLKELNCLDAVSKFSLTSALVEGGEANAVKGMERILDAGTAAPAKMRNDMLFNLANRYFEAGKEIQKAEPLLQELLDAEGDLAKADSFQLFAKVLMALGKPTQAVKVWKRLLKTQPQDASLWYDFAREVELGGTVQLANSEVSPALRHAQRLSIDSWRQTQEHIQQCRDPPLVRQVDWSDPRMNDVIVSHEVWHQPSAPAETYGFQKPRLIDQKKDLLQWPPLLYKDRAVRIARLKDVALAGDSGVIVDQHCRVWLLSDDYHVPLHKDLSMEHFAVGAPVIEAATSLVTLFATTFYHFIMVALPRIAVLRESLLRRPDVKLIVPAVGFPEAAPASYVKPLLEILNVGLKPGRMLPYRTTPLMAAIVTAPPAPVRFQVKELLVADWEVGTDGSTSQLDTHNIAARSALLRLYNVFHDDDRRKKPAAKRSVIIFARRTSRMFRAEATLRKDVSRVVPPGWRIHILVDDELPPLPKLKKLFIGAAVVVAAHGAALANALHCTTPMAIVELIPPQPHAHYYAHLAAVLGFHYWAVPLRASSSHQGEYLEENATADIQKVVEAATRTLQDDDGLNHAVPSAEL